MREKVGVVTAGSVLPDALDHIVHREHVSPQSFGRSEDVTPSLIQFAYIRFERRSLLSNRLLLTERCCIAFSRGALLEMFCLALGKACHRSVVLDESRWKVLVTRLPSRSENTDRMRIVHTVVSHGVTEKCVRYKPKMYAFRDMLPYLVRKFLRGATPGFETLVKLIESLKATFPLVHVPLVIDELPCRPIKLHTEDGSVVLKPLALRCYDERLSRGPDHLLSRRAVTEGDFGRAPRFRCEPSNGVARRGIHLQSEERVQQESVLSQ